MTVRRHNVLSTTPGAPHHAAVRWWRRAWSVVRLAASLLAVWAVLPAGLGGRVTFTVVSGTSMEPTYRTYDVALTYRTQRIVVGDVIVYRVPAGQPGAGGQVIHRVIGGDGVHGYVTRGDNREGPDIWRPQQRDVVGKVVASIPHGGRVLALAFDPGNVGVVAVSLLIWAVWPRRPEHAGGHNPTAPAT